MPAEIVGPFEHRELVVDGWTVPFINAIETDGGRIHFTVDHRFGFDFAAAEFDQVSKLVATCIAIALGMPCWPNEEDDMEARQQSMGHLHMGLRPRRLIGITGIGTEDIEPTESDDPRDAAA